MALFENLLFCMFFDSNMEIRAKALEIIDYIRSNNTAQNTVRKLDHFEQSKYLDFDCTHYSGLMGDYKKLPLHIVTMPPLLEGSEYEDMRLHCTGKKEFKIFSNGQEIDFLKISTNNVAIEAQVKWTTEAVSTKNTKEKQLTKLLTTKDVHSKVKSDCARSELCSQ